MRVAILCGPAESAGGVYCVAYAAGRQIDGTQVATYRCNFARPHLTADGNTQPQRREALFASLLAIVAALWGQQFDHRRAIVDVFVAARHFRFQIPLDVARMLDICRAAFEDVRQKCSRHAAQMRRHFLVEMPS